MTENKNLKHPHFILKTNGETEKFTSPNKGRNKASIQGRDREAHGNFLLRKIQQLAPIFTQAAKQQREAGLEEGFGLQVEFESFPGIDLAFESLPRERSGIELRNVRYDDM